MVRVAGRFGGWGVGAGGGLGVGRAGAGLGGGAHDPRGGRGDGGRSRGCGHALRLRRRSSEALPQRRTTLREEVVEGSGEVDLPRLLVGAVFREREHACDLAVDDHRRPAVSGRAAGARVRPQQQQRCLSVHEPALGQGLHRAPHLHAQGLGAREPPARPRRGWVRSRLGQGRDDQPLGSGVVELHHCDVVLRAVEREPSVAAALHVPPGGEHEPDVLRLGAIGREHPAGADGEPGRDQEGRGEAVASGPQAADEAPVGTRGHPGILAVSTAPPRPEATAAGRPREGTRWAACA